MKKKLDVVLIGMCGALIGLILAGIFLLILDTDSVQPVSGIRENINRYEQCKKWIM